MISKNVNIIKLNTYTYDPKEFELALIPKKTPYSAVIKRSQIDYSYEQKQRLGILTAEEFGYWQMELQEKLMAERAERARTHDGATFWSNDRKVRRNVSQDDYGKFLAENNIDISNTTKVDVSAIINEQNQSLLSSIGYTSAQDNINAIVQDTNVPAEDPNRVLTTEEIEALFAAMAAE